MFFIGIYNKNKMRRFDKKYNIEKANLLAEQRYLQSKGILSEGYYADPIAKGTKIKYNGRDAEVISFEANPYQEVSYTIKYDDNGEQDQITGGDSKIELNENIGVQKTDSDIDDLANEIIRNSNGDETKENELIVKTAAGDEEIQRRLTNRISRIKNN